MSFADPVLLAVGLLVAVALAWAAIVVARRRAIRSWEARLPA